MARMEWASRAQSPYELCARLAHALRSGRGKLPDATVDSLHGQPVFHSACYSHRGEGLAVADCVQLGICGKARC